MKDFACDIHFATKGSDHTLLTHADTKDRDFSTEVLDCSIADSCIGLWVAGAGTDHQLGRLLRDQVFNGNLVIAVNGHGSTFEDQVLIDVPGE